MIFWTPHANLMLLCQLKFGKHELVDCKTLIQKNNKYVSTERWLKEKKRVAAETSQLMHLGRFYILFQRHEHFLKPIHQIRISTSGFCQALLTLWSVTLHLTLFGNTMLMIKKTKRYKFNYFWSIHKNMFEVNNRYFSDSAKKSCLKIIMLFPPFFFHTEGVSGVPDVLL